MAAVKTKSGGDNESAPHAVAGAQSEVMREATCGRRREGNRAGRRRKDGQGASGVDECGKQIKRGGGGGEGKQQRKKRKKEKNARKRKKKKKHTNEELGALWEVLKKRKR
jgi:hypothetical protein